nr:hypothetical protein HmN_000849000 [Hymenolepis microstoma]
MFTSHEALSSPHMQPFAVSDRQVCPSDVWLRPEKEWTDRCGKQFDWSEEEIEATPNFRKGSVKLSPRSKDVVTSGLEMRKLVRIIVKAYMLAKFRFGCQDLVVFPQFSRGRKKKPPTSSLSGDRPKLPSSSILEV